MPSRDPSPPADSLHLSPAEIRKALAPFRRPSDAAAWWQLFSTALLLAGAAALMWLSLGVGYWLTLILALPAAGLLVRLFIFQHDCGHGSFFHSQRLNHIVGSCLGLITLTPYFDWRHTHALHHGSHGDLDRRGDGDVLTLTVDEYARLGWWKRLGYRLYRHPMVIFGLFPALLFVVRFRVPIGIPRDRRRERRSVWLTNLGLLATVAAAMVAVGLDVFLLLYAPVLVVAASIGVWMFYVQHQFDPTYWQRHEQWNRIHASLQGSSYYRLPRVLQWFTGNIGLHHIHHLDSRIPNYRLQRCLEANRGLLDVPPLTLRSSLRCARLKLWDERGERMVSFRTARAIVTPLAIVAA